MNAIADEWTALADSAADSCRVFPDPAYQPGTELAEQFCMLEQKNAGSEKGADVKNVSAMLGHSSAGFTLATYTHTTTAAQHQAAAIMGNLVSTGIQEPTKTEPAIRIVGDAG